MAVLVDLPYTARPIALPLLVAMCRDRKTNTAEGRRHKTPAEVISGTGGWFKSGKGLVMFRWVYVRDLDGTHRDEYFFTTDTSMSAGEVIEM